MLRVQSPVISGPTQTTAMLSRRTLTTQAPCDHLTTWALLSTLGSHNDGILTRVPLSVGHNPLRLRVLPIVFRTIRTTSLFK